MASNKKKELSPEEKALAKRMLFVFLGVAFLLVVIDFASKWLVQRLCTPFEPIQVIPNFFYITLSHNTGAAFSMGADWGIWGRILGIAISLIMSVAILWYWITHNEEFKTFERVIAALMAGGAIGNLIDRSFYFEAITGFDGVIDFLQFYLGGGPSAPQSIVNPFATFNIADACLVIGIILFVIYTIIETVNENKKGANLRTDPRLAKKKELPEKEEEPSESEEEEDENAQA